MEWPVYSGWLVDDLANPDICTPKILNDVQRLQDVRRCGVDVSPMLMVKCLRLIDVNPNYHVDVVLLFL